MNYNTKHKVIVQKKKKKVKNQPYSVWFLQKVFPPKVPHSFYIKFLKQWNSKILAPIHICQNSEILFFLGYISASVCL